MKQIDSKELLARTKTLVAQERQTTLQLIMHLQEIERRMLYAKLGYGSLWEFATQELGLSEGAAQRRIQAMRLARDVPQAKAALECGKLSLSNAAKVQSFRQAQKRAGRTTDTPLLISKVESLSQHECEKVLLEISPQALKQERERLVTASGDRELKFVVTTNLHNKLQRLKALLSHAMPDATYAQLLEYVVDQTLPSLEKKKGIISRTEDATLTKIQNAAAAVEAVKTLPVGVRVHIPAAMQRAIWARGNGQCEIVVGDRRCQSHMRLEIDHIIPLTLNGTNQLDNLRLACWHHNQQQAQEKLCGSV